MRYVLLVVVALLSLQCTKKNTNEILVGQFGSMTGSEATFGISTDRGIQLAFEEINNQGGVHGKKLKLITLDNQGKPEEAAQAVTRLITQDKVVAILGEVASTRSIAAAPIAQQYKVPMISPASTNPKVTEIGDYIFRVCFLDPFQGTAMAQFAMNNLKLKKFAILRDVKSDYSMGLADFFAAKVKEMGGEIITDVSYSNGDTNFKAQLTKIKASQPDAVFVPGYYTEVGLIAKQTKELGIQAPLLGGDGWDSAKLYEIGGAAVNGNYFSNHYTTETKDPQVLEFVNKYKAKFHESPDSMAALGYDAARILAEAMKASTDVTSTNIRTALTQIRDFPGITGKITIDGKRNASKSLVVVKVDGPLNQFITTISP